MGFSFGVVWFMPIGLPMGLGGLGMLASFARTNSGSSLHGVGRTGLGGRGWGLRDWMNGVGFPILVKSTIIGVMRPG
jgi:hypothetical protein